MHVDRRLHWVAHEYHRNCSVNRCYPTMGDRLLRRLCSCNFLSNASSLMPHQCTALERPHWLICKLTIINSEILASFKFAQKLKDLPFRILNLVLQLHHKNNQFLSTSGFKTHFNKLWWEYSNCFSYCCVLFYLNCAQTNKTWVLMLVMQC